MRRILITGAGGFAGRHARAAIAARFPGAEIAGAGLGPGCEIALDVTDAAAVARVVAGFRPEACLHLAAIAGAAAARADPARAFAVNLGGSLHLAQAVLAAAPGCLLVHVSSADGYGCSFGPGAALDERAALAPRSLYAASKAAGDLALGALAEEGLRVVRLRPFNHTGPGQSPDFVVPGFARQVVRIARADAPPEIVTGALEPERDFLDVRDVARAYAAALERGRDIVPGTILNLASGVGRRIGDVLADLLRLSGVTARVRVDPGRLRRGEIARAVGDAGRARRLLGWAPAIPWERTLADVLADWRARAGEDQGGAGTAERMTRAKA